MEDNELTGGGSTQEPIAPMSIWQFLGAIGTVLLALPAIIGA